MLKKGSSKATMRKNFEEFGQGKTYAKTKAKSGKKAADKQRVAVVMRAAGKSRSKK